jgi:hypothetical protein
MDIRVQAYRPVTVQSFGGAGGRAVAVSDARQGGPVRPVPPVSGNAGQAAANIGQAVGATRQTANGGGYTDATRGGNVNILA